MIISKEWAMPNKETFKIYPINKLLHRYTDNLDGVVLDPFSNGEKQFCTVNNDLNENIECDYHLDAIEFLRMFKGKSVDMVLYDPPYSPRQVSECYKGVGKTVTQLDTSAHFRSSHLDQIASVLKIGGRCISFGWNTNGVGKNRGFVTEEILIVNHGGSHNDTLVTVDRKVR